MESRWFSTRRYLWRFCWLANRGEVTFAMAGVTLLVQAVETQGWLGQYRELEGLPLLVVELAATAVLEWPLASLQSSQRSHLWS